MIHIKNINSRIYKHFCTKNSLLGANIDGFKPKFSNFLIINCFTPRLFRDT